MKSSRNIRGRRDQEGFTFIEVTVFLVVAVLAVGGLFNLFDFALRTAHLPARETQALLLARERLEQILADRQRLGYDVLIQNLGRYGDETPIGGSAPLLFNTMNRRVAFTPAVLVDQELRCGNGPPLPVADLLCVTVTVQDGVEQTPLAVLSSLVSRHE